MHNSTAPDVAVRNDDAEMFELAPVSLWLEDYSALKAAVRRVAARRRDRPARRICAPIRARVQECSELHPRAQGQPQDADAVRRRATCRIWSPISAACSATTCSRPMSRSWCSSGRARPASSATRSTIRSAGARLDIQLKGTVLPGHEDELGPRADRDRGRDRARERAPRPGASENYARGLFEHSPVSLWVEDFSAIKRLLDEMRERGIDDFRVFTDVHPEFVTRCMSEIRVHRRQPATRSNCSARPTRRPCSAALATCSATTCSSISASS